MTDIRIKKSEFFFLFIITILCCWFFCGNLSGADREQVLVLDMAAENFEPQWINKLTEIMKRELGNKGIYTLDKSSFILQPSDSSLEKETYVGIKTVLKNNNIDSCAQLECAVKAGGLAGAGKVIFGLIIKTNGILELTIKLADVKNVQVETGYKVRAKSEERLEDFFLMLSAKFATNISKLMVEKEESAIIDKSIIENVQANTQKARFITETTAKEGLDREKIQLEEKASLKQQTAAEKPDEQTLVSRDPGIHFVNEIKFLLNYFSQSIDDMNYVYTDFGDYISISPYESAKDECDHFEYTLSYSYYLAPVYYYKGFSYSLMKLLSKASYINFRVSYLPSEKGIYEYTVNAPGYFWQFKQNYDYKRTLCCLYGEFFPLAWTSLSGNFYYEAYNSMSDYENTDGMVGNFSSKSYGVGYSFGIRQFLQKLFFVSFWFNHYGTSPDTIENDTFADKSWEKYDSEQNYAANVYKLELYYVSKKLKSKQKNLIIDNTGLGFSWTRNKSDNRRDSILTFSDPFENPETVWKTYVVSGNTFNIYVDLYFKKDKVFKIGYEWGNEAEKTVNNNGTTENIDTGISNFIFGLELFKSERLEFELHFEIGSEDSQHKKMNKEPLALYKESSWDSFDSINDLTLAMSYRF